MDTQVADPLLNSLVDGRYRVRGRVARGGVATVYTAIDERLGRTVALKMIHPSRSGDTHFVDRFTDQAKTIARLTHPNVVAVYDQGQHAGSPYLVMEYVRGRTLREVLAERRALSAVEALAVLEQMLAAIAAAHRVGLVHRDVKPENVLVAEAPTAGVTDLVDSVAKVADFGLARAVEASAAPGGGQLMATVAYVAPELVTDGHADPRTDVYSAGIVLFEMLTGRVPYDGDKPIDVAWQHVDRDVPPPSRFVPGLPKALDDLVARATRRDPNARPTDAGALLAEVQTVRDNLGSTTNAATTIIPAVTAPVAEPTMVVSHLQPAQRPSWARLPEAGRSTPAAHQPRGGRRRPPSATAPGLFDRLQLFWRQTMATSRGRVWIATCLAVLGLVAATGGWWMGVGRYTSAPDLGSLTKANAAAVATEAGLTVTHGTPRYDDKIPKDSVVSQDPLAGDRIRRGGEITLVLSLGPERFAVPDVVGQAFDVAKTELEQAGLVVKRGPDRYNDNLPKGMVVTLNPKVGDQVTAGATITITVSKGKSPITVPRVIGKNINEARPELEQRGLKVLEEQVDSDKPAGEVLAQQPSDGTGVEKGATVQLQVSKGPPMVIVPRVIDMPCEQAKQALEGAQLTVTMVNPHGVVRFQNPGENTQVPPGSQVVIGCF